ncbi:hypothetical protein [Ruegeria arenilitoris]|uniref:hypothetical protein n=1 Tax=Ruegeria arenilitoris TaxID=1173585 RepID=UPI00147BB387|nr:hypothetical protein [Ruegeria arenilitoris]
MVLFNPRFGLVVKLAFGSRPAHVARIHWPTYSQQKLEDLIARIDDPELLSLGLHNRAVSMLTPETQDRLFDALASRGISDRETTQSVLNATASLAG